MRVLVTGSEGYIGAVMVPFLQQAGHEVVGLDSGLFVGCDHGPGPTHQPTIRRDLREVRSEDLEGIDAVVHLAALSNDPLRDLVPGLTYDINHHASVRLAKVAREAGVRRYLYSSSCSVYGASDTGSLVTEEAEFAPVTPYAESKVAVEHELADLVAEDFVPMSFRNATAYGWSPRLRLDIVLNDLVAGAVLNGEIVVLSDGTPWRPMVHVEDICRAFLCGLEAPEDAVRGEAFNVGTAADNHQVKDLATIAAGVVEGATVEIDGRAGSDPRSYRVSFEKIERQLPGWAPRWDAEKGAVQLRDAFREHGLDAQDPKLTFRRLAWLRKRLDEGTIDEHLHPTDLD